TLYAYDMSGDLRAVVDAAGRATTLVHDPRDRLIKVTDANAGIQTIAYDPIGDVLQTVDPLGITNTMSYDKRGWLTSLTEPAGTPVQRTTTMLNDAAGDVLSTTEGQSSNNPHVLTTSFV